MGKYEDNGNKLDWALMFQRTGKFPLDRTSMFDSYEDAVKYAQGNSANPDSRGLQGSSYIGQIIAVYENDTVSVYKIDANRTLSPIGSGGGGGTSDYPDLTNKPSINNVVLNGNKTSSDLGLQPAGNYASSQSVENINEKIPNQASSINQLADKDFVNSSVSTATATFRGTFDNLNTLQAVEGDRNDYAFYSHKDSNGNTIYDRYKYVGIPESELPEGYIEVDSINCTGDNGYINTEIMPSSTLVIETALNSPNFNEYAYVYFMGSGSYSVWNDQFGRAMRIRRGGSTQLDILTTKSFEINSKNTIKIAPNGIYVNGTNIGSISYEDTATNPIYLFTQINNDGTFANSLYGTTKKIYRTKFINNNEVIADMIPCYREIDYKAGFYDVVRNKFYINDKNENNFTYTPLSTDKWEYEYSLNNSSFTSEQWATINSGLTSQVAADINKINSLIPSQAGVNNQLADKGYVENSISTATASFKGTFTSLTNLQATEGDRNDYAFYSHQDSSGNTIYDRYKYVGPKEVILPAGYTQVKRITGNYINLNIAPRNDWHFILKVSSPYFADWAPAVPVFGVQSGDTRYDMYKPSYENPLLLKTTAGAWGIQVSNNDIHTIEVKSSRAMYIDGSLIATLSSTTNLPSAPVYLLGINSNGSAWKQDNVHCYGLTIYDNEENLLMDLVPCIRDQDGSMGVYDLAGTINPDTNSPFYGGATSSSPLSEDKWEYEYSLNNSSFTSEQWATINSGLTAQTATDITAINSKIPSQASATNQLADKDFVESAISTATASFRGTYTSLPTLQAVDGDRNDYAFYSHQDTSGNTIYDRYKYVGLPDSRVPEGYTERLYVIQTRYESSYIDTGYKVQSTDKIVIKYYGFEYTAAETLLLGAKDSNNNFFQLRKDYGAPTMYLETNNGSVALGNGYNKSFIIEVYDGKVYVSDIDGSNKQLKGSLTLSSVNSNLYIFRSNDNGTPSTAYGQWISIGDFTIYDSNDNKVLELVPCTNSLSVNGYYETVDGRFIEPTDGTLNAQAISTDRWLFEYSLNNLSLTSAQWSTLNSGLVEHVTSNGFDATKTQVLKNINGTLTWVDETT